MFKDILEIYTVSIVLLGDFNPTIIQPYWLSNKKLIGEQDAANADIKLIHKDLVRFDSDWFFLDVNKVRFELRTSKQPYFEPLKDLTVGIFHFLKETPIRAVGINHIFHLPFRDDDQNIKFGNSLASLNNFSTFMDNPRVYNLQVIDQKRKDDKPGSVTVGIAPSGETTSKFGVSINMNDHFILGNSEPGRNGEIIEILKNEWQNSFENAKNISEKIWSTFA
jgi:hypothetical protein